MDERSVASAVGSFNFHMNFDSSKRDAAVGPAVSAKAGNQ